MSFFNTFVYACESKDIDLISVLMKKADFKTSFSKCFDYIIKKNDITIFMMMVSDNSNKELIIQSFDNNIINKIIIDDNISLYSKIQQFKLIEINNDNIDLCCRYDSVNIFKSIVDITNIVNLYNYYINSIECQSFKICKFVIDNLTSIVYNDTLIYYSIEYHYPYIEELINKYVKNNRPCMNILTYLIQFEHYDLFYKVISKKDITETKLIDNLFLLNFNQAIVECNNNSVIQAVSNNSKLNSIVFSEFNCKTLLYNTLELSESDVMLKYILKSRLVPFDIFNFDHSRHIDIFNSIIHNQKLWSIQIMFDFDMKIQKKYLNIIFPYLVEMQNYKFVDRILTKKVSNKVIDSSLITCINNNDIKMVKILLDTKKYSPDFYIYNDIYGKVETTRYIDDIDKDNYSTLLEHTISKLREGHVNERIIFYLLEYNFSIITPKAVELLCLNYIDISKNVNMRIRINKWGAKIFRYTFDYIKNNLEDNNECLIKCLNNIFNLIIDKNKLSKSLNYCSICFSDDISEQMLFNEYSFHCKKCSTETHLSCILPWITLEDKNFEGNCPGCRTKFNLRIITNI